MEWVKESSVTYYSQRQTTSPRERQQRSVRNASDCPFRQVKSTLQRILVAETGIPGNHKMKEAYGRCRHRGRAGNAPTAPCNTRRRGCGRHWAVDAADDAAEPDGHPWDAPVHGAGPTG